MAGKREKQKKLRNKREKKRLKNRKSIIAKKPEGEIPTDDYFLYNNLNMTSDLEEVVGDFISDVEHGYFLTWEAVVRSEQELPLSKKQEESLSGIICFDDEPAILYIDERPRPSQPWYEILKIIVTHILVDKYETFDTHYAVTCEGWSKLVECIKLHSCDLPLPDDIDNPIDVIPLDIQHRLWFQHCFDFLSGLGQCEELTLENEEQQCRIEFFIKNLIEHKDSIEYLNMTLDKMLEIVILPERDKELFINSMLKELNLSSVNEPLANGLVYYQKINKD